MIKTEERVLHSKRIYESFFLLLLFYFFMRVERQTFQTVGELFNLHNNFINFSLTHQTNTMPSKQFNHRAYLRHTEAQQIFFG